MFQLKKKIIWEDLVDIKKVFEALIWLKNNNPLYSEIVLPDIHDKLFLGNLDDVEFEMQKSENDASDDCEPLLNNLELHVKEINDHVELALDDPRKQCSLKKIR